MLIGPAQKKDFPPTQTHKPCEDIAGCTCVSVANVWFVVDVVDGRRYLIGSLAIVDGSGWCSDHYCFQ